MGTENLSQEKVVSVSEIEKIIPPEKLEEYRIKSLASKRVANDPLPGPFEDAMGDGDVEVVTSKGKIVVRPVVAYDFTIFKKINSPIFQQMVDVGVSTSGSAELDFDEEDMYELIFQFTRPCKEVRKELKKGREEYREAALAKIADVYGTSDIELIVKVITEQIQKGFSTMVEHEIVSSDDDKKKQQ